MDTVLEFTDTLLYLDSRGHTGKSQGEYDKHKNLTKLKSLTSAKGNKYGFEILEKPVTIVNKTHYQRLSEIISTSQEMWDSLGYWSDNILFRSGSYTTKQGLLSKNFPNQGIDHNTKQLKKLIKEAGNPDQFLLHPLPSDEIFRDGFYATRCMMIDGITKFEIGFGDIDHTWKLEQAKSIVKGEIQDKPNYEATKGKLSPQHKKIIDSIAYGLFQFCLKAPGIVVPKRSSGTRPFVYEFKVFHIEAQNRTILEFIDFELFN